MKKGVLFPIFSLPSEYGIGDFGYEAYQFIDILKENNIDYWEILPINESNNKLPYSPNSFYALNIDYISIDKLINMGLIKSAVKKERNSQIHYDYFKEIYYKEAFKNFRSNSEFEKFCKNKKMLEYAKFMSEHENENMDQKYYLFLQYILDKQWNEVKDYANKNNVQIIGDMPIYPDFESVEIQFHAKNYELKNNKLEFVSGAPPDNFNPNGQKWGHPVYNFEYMKNNNYSYLIDKFKEYLKRYDLVRVDHFMAFDRYYKIPINKEPIDGFYQEGPKDDFFDKLFETVSPHRILVEDLGLIQDETTELKDKYNFTGSKLLHYSIDLKTGKDTILDQNRIVYTSNHDTNTTIGWYKSLKLLDKMRLKKFLKKNKCYNRHINIALIKYCFKTNPKIAIIPVQDILGLDEKARINNPGYESSENWSWELLNFNELKEKIKILNENELIKI